MSKLIYKSVIYTASVALCVILFVQLGGELIVQITMMFQDVSDRTMLDKHPVAAMIATYAILPEAIVGFISGWYLADWISEKIWNY